jgi:glyoxylase-like metal-dependent hydrolase (beta-lactamase superfamily II)
MQIPHLAIGRATVHFLNDGFWWDDGGAMFGIVPKELWVREKPADDRNRIHMSLACPLIQVDGEVILIDAGIGDRLRGKEADIYRPDRGTGLVGCLARLGLEPTDVTMVVLSHLHFDHCGGIVARTGSGALGPTFPRARHIVQRQELEAALQPTNPRDAAAYRHVAECLEPLGAHAVERIDGSTALTPSVRAVVSGGHTPSHQCVVVESDGAGLVHLADLAPTIPHLRPAWAAAYDLDPLQVLEEKTRLLAEVAAKGWWVSLDHDDRVASGRLRHEGKRPVLTDVLPTPVPTGSLAAGA